jgi:hypothetical protein
MTTYKIVRQFFQDHRKRTIDTGLALEQAQQHCSDPNTSSTTATSAQATRRTAKYGPWFDGYEKE